MLSSLQAQGLQCWPCRIVYSTSFSECVTIVHLVWAAIKGANLTAMLWSHGIAHACVAHLGLRMQFILGYEFLGVAHAKQG